MIFDNFLNVFEEKKIGKNNDIDQGSGLRIRVRIEGQGSVNLNGDRKIDL